jgi:hypothetical protein
MQSQLRIAFIVRAIMPAHRAIADRGKKRTGNPPELNQFLHMASQLSLVDCYRIARRIPNLTHCEAVQQTVFPRGISIVSPPAVRRAMRKVQRWAERPATKGRIKTSHFFD